MIQLYLKYWIGEPQFSFLHGMTFTHYSGPSLWCCLFKCRSKRKTESIRRKKIRPCLKVCQKVEEQCPYLLPGDRAPGYNTQYAGEPTFLCRGNDTICSLANKYLLGRFWIIRCFFSSDPNIPETGEQLAKSNNGPDTCCYEYCDPFSVYSGICAHCDKDDIQSNLLPYIDHQHTLEPGTNENEVSLIRSISFQVTKRKRSINKIINSMIRKYNKNWIWMMIIPFYSGDMMVLQ